MLTKRPFRVIIAFIALSIVGVAVVPGLKVNFVPNESSPTLSISYSLPDSSPDIVERLATSPIENALSQVKGVNKVYSISRYNRGVIRLNFDKDEDMDFKTFEINSIIRNIYKKLPERLSYPRVDQQGGEDDKQESPILFYSVNGPFAPYKLQEDVEEYVTKSLSQDKDIQRIEVRGANRLQITVAFDVPTLTRYGLSKSEISSALTSLNNSIYAGMARTANDQRFFLRTTGQLPDLASIENTRVKEIEGKSIFIKDVANVFIEEEAPTAYRRINSKNAVYVNVYAREGVNKIVLAKRTIEQINKLAANLPDGVEMFLEQDDTKFLNQEMDKIYLRTALSVLILVLFILAINRNVKYLFALFLGILVNLCLTAIIVYTLGVELHIFSIAGVTISFGLIVDNAIVMMDHLHRKRNAKIFVALLAASITTIMALLMVLLLPEKDRQNLTDFSIVVAINLGVSLIIALFFTPALYSLLFSKGRTVRKLSMKGLRRRVRIFKAYMSSVAFVTRYRKIFTVLVILGFGLPVFKMPLQWEGQEWYNKTIGSDKYQDDIRPVSDKVLGGALRKFVTEVYEGYSYRNPEQTRLFVNARLPFGTTLQDADFVISTIEEYLKGVKGIDKYVTNVRSKSASVEITFKPEYNDSALPYQLKARLQARSVDLTGVRWSIYGVGRAFGIGGDSQSAPSFKVRMKGYNFDILAEQAEKMAVKLGANRRVDKVNLNEQISWGREATSEYVLDFDIDRLAAAGISRGKVMQLLGDLAAPRSPSLSANYQDERLPVYVEAKSANAFSKYDLLEEALPLDTNRFIRIKDYASLTFEESANEIHKEDRQYLRVVGFDYLGSYKFGNQHREKVVNEMNAEMPVGYFVESQENLFSFDKTKRQYGLLLFLVLGIYFICAVLFESLRQPFYIIITIPVSFIGLFLIFSLFDFPFDQGGYAAFVMLGGLVVNASIFIVNDLNNSRLKHHNRSVIKAVLGKAQPIMLTILSTCFGLIPFLVEGQSEVFWFALAIGTIGGLVFSVVGVFLCLPVFLSRKGRKTKLKLVGQ